MRIKIIFAAIALILVPAISGISADTLGPDIVRLNDGTLVSGTFVSASGNNITVNVNGTNRTIHRSQVSAIIFGLVSSSQGSGSSGSDSGSGAVEEKLEFNVVLVSTGGSKVQVIKVIRTITGLGLKEAKDMAESAPVTVKSGVSKEEAQSMKRMLEDAGATVEIK